jgi:hypothetical protein
MKLNIVLMMVLVVGCGEGMPVVYTDSGVLPGDAQPTADAQVEVPDAGQADSEVDGGHEVRPDSGADTGGSPDAGVDDGGVDASSGTPDSGPSPSDAGTDAAVAVRSVVELGVNGNTSCVLTSTNEMWCWGGGAALPSHVADAVALEGNCGIGLDGRVLCWTAAGGVTYAVGAAPYGSDVSVLGVQTYVGRTDGLVHPFNLTSPTYAPATAIDSMPALNCAIDIAGGLRCWDRVGTYRNFWTAVDGTATYDATDVARTGTFNSNDFVACFTWTGTMPSSGSTTISGPSVSCSNAVASILTTSWTGATEVDIDGGRTCVLLPTSTSGHPAGIYCSSSTPSTFTGPATFNALPAADVVGAYTNIVGSSLQLGINHACLVQAGVVMCWGDNSQGQLGNGTTTSTSTPTPMVW